MQRSLPLRGGGGANRRRVVAKGVGPASPFRATRRLHASALMISACRATSLARRGLHWLGVDRDRRRRLCASTAASRNASLRAALRAAMSPMFVWLIATGRAELASPNNPKCLASDASAACLSCISVRTCPDFVKTFLIAAAASAGKRFEGATETRSFTASASPSGEVAASRPHRAMSRISANAIRRSSANT